MTVNLEEVRKYLIKAMSGYRHHSDYEDAFQEGMIRAWKDIEEGNDSFLHVAHRARQWAWNFLKDVGGGRRHHTGAPKVSLDGRRSAQGEATREKIRQYISEYSKLHDKEPTNKEISQATGLSTAVVSNQRKNMREGKGTNHAIYSDQYGETRIDYSAYKIGAITDENYDMILSHEHTEFEESLIANLDFNRILENIDPAHRTVLYHHYFIGHTPKEVAEIVGLAGYSKNGISRLNAAHKAVLAYLYPDEYAEVCRNGHTRTQKNTTITVRDDGQMRKACLDCQADKRKRDAALQRKYKEKKKSAKALATHCKEGHEIRGYRPSSGKRYCKICNSLNNNPGRTEADIPADSPLWNWDDRP